MKWPIFAKWFRLFNAFHSNVTTFLTGFLENKEYINQLLFLLTTHLKLLTHIPNRLNGKYGSVFAVMPFIWWWSSVPEFDNIFQETIDEP